MLEQFIFLLVGEGIIASNLDFAQNDVQFLLTHRVGGRSGLAGRTTGLAGRRGSLLAALELRQSP